MFASSKIRALLSCLTLLCGDANAAASSFTSSNDGVYKLSSYTAPTLNGPNSGNISSTWSLTVDDTASGLQQSITGYGAAITDCTVTNFGLLKSAQQKALLQDLFSTGGLNFSLMRHTIAASDMSSFVYSYDNVSVADPSLRHFNLSKAGRAMTSLIKRMKTVNPEMKLLGSMWSPPGWMKLNCVQSGETYNNNLNPTYSSAYAQYFVEYLQKFSAQGAPVDAITIQNEPLNSQDGYPTMYVSADNSTNLIENFVGPALAKAGLSTEIWAYDHNTDVPSYPQEVIDGASKYVNTVAWHCYANPVNWTVLTAFYESNPSVTQYMTECWTSPTNSWYSTIDFVMGPMQNRAAGAIAWNLASDTNYGPYLPGGCTTCRGLVVVNTTTGTYSKTADYYWMGQFSKYVQRGSTALATTGSYDYGSGSKIEVAAFLNADGSRVVVLQNGFGNNVFMTVSFKSGETWTGPLYSQSLTTWLLPASAE